MTTTKKPRALLAILGLGLLIRIWFLIYGAQLVYGPGNEHHNGDTFSFVQSFRNLWHYGYYTFDPSEPDAALGRLPGYPFFYGLHELLAGPRYAAQALAVSQLLLSMLNIWLVYRLALRLSGRERTAQVAALLLALYPFEFIWITVIGTETLAVTLTLLWLAILLHGWGGKARWVLVGAVLAVALLVRVYLGILTPITLVWLLLRGGLRPGLRRAAVVGITFSLLYIGWPIRNYVSFGRLVLLKPPSAGYPDLREDMQAFLAWMHCWDNDDTYWVDGVVGHPSLRFPPEIFSSAAEERLAYGLVAQARRCGSSFYQYQHKQNRLRYHNCNTELARGFTQLREHYVQTHPVRYWLVVPLKNLSKGLFKSSLQKPGLHLKGQSWLLRMVFAWRSFLLLAALAGTWQWRRQREWWPGLAYCVFIYFFISFVFRSLEMRYLLHADVLLLIPAAHFLTSRWWRPADGTIAAAQPEQVVSSSSAESVTAAQVDSAQLGQKLFFRS